MHPDGFDFPRVCECREPFIDDADIESIRPGHRDPFGRPRTDATPSRACSPHIRPTSPQRRPPGRGAVCACNRLSTTRPLSQRTDNDPHEKDEHRPEKEHQFPSVGGLHARPEALHVLSRCPEVCETTRRSVPGNGESTGEGRLRSAPPRAPRCRRQNRRESI